MAWTLAAVGDVVLSEVVSFANNHPLDYGTDALLDYACAFDERGECQPVDGPRRQILERLTEHCAELGVQLAVTDASCGVVTAPA